LSGYKGWSVDLGTFREDAELTPVSLCVLDPFDGIVIEPEEFAQVLRQLLLLFLQLVRGVSAVPVDLATGVSQP
jgi:hypothetical protein